MFGVAAAREKALRQEALLEAKELFQHYGTASVEMLTARIHAPDLTAEQRRRYRLARVEAERLGRQRRDTQGAHALVVWKPRLLSLAGIARILGFRRRRR